MPIAVEAAPSIGFAAKAAALQLRAKLPEKEQAARALEAKAQELQALRTTAGEITIAIGKLAAEGKLPADKEAIGLLKALVQSMEQINERMKKVEEDMTEVKGWIEGQDKNIPGLQKDVAKLKRLGISNYVQFQWSDTQQDGSRVTNDGFQMRRFRIGQTNKIDDRTSMKLAFDVSTGSNRVSAELRDAILMYEIRPSKEMDTSLWMGQQPMPLGYELARSSSEREFPERALYNTTLFAGERDRGLKLTHGLGRGFSVHVGAWTGMTFNDPQQTATGFRDPDNKVAMTGGVRWRGTKHDVGFGTLQGERPGFVPTVNPGAPVPRTDRRVYYLDGTYTGLFKDRLTLRGELMWGKDRPPTGGTNDPTFRRQTDVLGYQAQLTYNLNPRNQLHVRHVMFDPDTTNSPNDLTANWGFGYTYWLNPGAKITTSFELFDEQGAPIRNNAWTVRAQFKL